MTAVKQKSLMKMRKKFNCKQLKARCDASVADLFNENGGIVGTQGKQYSFKDNGSKVLAVAHCDFVQGLGAHFSAARLTKETLIYSPRLDDRLGVYTVMDMLPSLGVNVDVLLTDNEEIGASTAGLFATEKEYNWIVEFDRRGDDVVTYAYEFDDVVGEEFKVGYGSFSDISRMEGVGVKAFNVGIGYYGEHTSRCHVVVEDYLSQMVRFVRFYDKHKKTRYEHEEMLGRYPSTGGVSWCDPSYYYDDYYDDMDDELVVCPDCSTSFFPCESMETIVSFYCPHCSKEINKGTLDAYKRMWPDGDEESVSYE